MLPALLPSTNSFTAPTGSPQAQVLQWFNGLGFPDLKDRPLVRVSTGNWSQSGNEPSSNHYEVAFLLKDDGATFSVFSADLSTKIVSAP